MLTKETILKQDGLLFSQSVGLASYHYHYYHYGWLVIIIIEPPQGVISQGQDPQGGAPSFHLKLPHLAGSCHTA